MNMNSLIIEETTHTPKVQFLMDGHLTISGKSLPEDTAKFYDPLLAWMNECELEIIHITIRLDYMNSSSAHQISKFMMSAKGNPSVKECFIEWYYETDDEDSLDFGKELEYLTDFPFKFFQYAETEA
jgi:hypothetical protein